MDESTRTCTSKLDALYNIAHLRFAFSPLLVISALKPIIYSFFQRRQTRGERVLISCRVATSACQLIANVPRRDFRVIKMWIIGLRDKTCQNVSDNERFKEDVSP